jgi:uncharacterized protein
MSHEGESMAASDLATSRAVGPVRQVLLQASSFCNIACRYCYLDERARSRRQEMSLDTARRTFQIVVESQQTAPSIDCRWHAGEPLTRRVSFYRDAFAIAQQTFSNHCDFQFSIQTNGLLLNDEWCSFLADTGTSLGLSLDGLAAWHDQNRVDRRGQGTWARVVKGIELLRRFDIPFDVICVAGDEALSDPAQTYEFFKELGCRSIGFNTDDLAPVATTAEALEFRRQQYASFMEVLASFEEANGFHPYIRELDQLRTAILSTGGPARSATAQPFAILNVNWQGDVSTCSPELLTLHSQWGPPRILGNVARDSWDGLVHTFFASEWGQQICSGTDQCARQCPYFDVCGGGSPGNKLFENGSFDSTETFFCRSRIQTLVPLVLRRLESRPGIVQSTCDHTIHSDRGGHFHE